MTDSASILSVGLNGFEVLFTGLTGFGLATVEVSPVASSAAASVEPEVVVPVNSSAVCSLAFASLSPGSGSGVCALAAPDRSAVASAADAAARIERAMGRLRLVLVAHDAEANVVPSFFSVVAIGESQLSLACGFPARTADHT